MLNLLTLKISNHEVSKNYEKYQAKKNDRVLWGALAAQVFSLLSSCYNAFGTKTGPVVTVLSNTLILVLLVCFKIFRYK